MKKRVISALIALAIFIPSLLIGKTIFKLFILMVALLSLNEFLDLRETKYKLPIPIKLLTFFVFTYLIFNFTTNGFTYSIDYQNISLIMFLFLLPIIIYHNNNVYNINDSMFLIGIVFFLGLSFNLVIILQEYSVNHVFYLFLIPAITDIYAYISGNLIGKHKLLPAISPNKTWEGLIVGTVFSVLISAVFYYIAIDSTFNLGLLFLITAFLSLIGQLGDLVFSSIKRFYKRKDFSNLIPGHGGLLDRLDSIIFVILAYILFINIL